MKINIIGTNVYRHLMYNGGIIILLLLFSSFNDIKYMSTQNNVKIVCILYFLH